MPNHSQKIPKKVVILLLFCVLLGLAPFYPEPHIYGKIKWIIGGAEGMVFDDWLDVVLHGTPWIIILVVVVRKLVVHSW